MVGWLEVVGGTGRNQAQHAGVRRMISWIRGGNGRPGVILISRKSAKGSSVSKAKESW